MSRRVIDFPAVGGILAARCNSAPARLALLGIVALFACHQPGELSRTGGLSLALVAAPGGNASLDSGRVLIRGPTNVTASVTPGTTGTFGGLMPGAYTVALEGFLGGAVDHYGQTSGIQVVAGMNTVASMTFGSFAPNPNPLPDSTLGRQLSVSFASVPSAVSYVVEWDTDSTFSRVTSTSGTQTPVTLAVAGYARYYLRVRAVDPYQTLGRPSTTLSTRTALGFVIGRVSIPSNAAVCVTVNPGLNTVLASGGAASGQTVEALDGATFQTLAVVNGSCPSVDSVTSRFWAAGVFSDSVLVYNGNSYALVATIGGGTGCPIGTAADPGRRRIWVAAQCGGGNDPVWAVNADAFALTSIVGSGGVMGSLVVNTATGRAYLGSSGVSKRIDPSSGFALTPNAFGVVGAVNPVTNRLYAPGGGGNGIQVIDGAANPEVVLTTVQLPFTPGAIGINSATNQVYVVNSAGGSLAVLDGATNALTGTILLGSGFNPSAIAVDPTRKRIYVIGTPASGPALSIIAGS